MILKIILYNIVIFYNNIFWGGDFLWERGTCPLCLSWDLRPCLQHILDLQPHNGYDMKHMLPENSMYIQVGVLLLKRISEGEKRLRWFDDVQSHCRKSHLLLYFRLFSHLSFGPNQHFLFGSVWFQSGKFQANQNVSPEVIW